MKRERFLTIDVWITLLIFLVILGHAHFPFSMSWYQNLQLWIYSFHMGAFFFISGFLVCYSYRPLSGLKDYGAYIWKKIKKFGIPFLFFGTTLCCIYGWNHGENISDFAQHWEMLFWDTMASPVIYLWFIWVLLLFYLFAPLFCQFYHYCIGIGIIAGVILLWYPLPRIFTLHMFSRYLIFFLLGIITCRHLKFFSQIPFWVSGLAWIPFIGIKIIWKDVPDMFYALLSLPCLYSISHLLASAGYGRSFFERVSRECYFIYLLQMIFIHILALCFQKLPVNNISFSSFLLCSEIAAIAGSLGIAWLFHRISAIWKENPKSCA